MLGKIDVELSCLECQLLDSLRVGCEEVTQVETAATTLQTFQVTPC